jgi:predicted peptidase
MIRWTLTALLLAPLSAWAADKPDLEKLLEAKTFTEGKTTLPYRLLKPATVEAGKKYPLVIFLHGSGERGKDNKAQLRHGIAEFASAERMKKFPCFLIAPQCPQGRQWAVYSPNPADVQPGKFVLDLVEKTCKDLPIDTKRVYLTGLSMGGYGTWNLLAQKPDLFAAGIPICGGGDEKNAAKLAKIPIWAFHGDKDNAVKVERSRNMVAAIEKAGGKPKYTEYPGVGHDSWTRTYADEKVLTWLFEQKKE